MKASHSSKTATPKAVLPESALTSFLADSQMAILNAIPAHIALVNAEGVIVAVNESWRAFSIDNPLHSPDFGVGCSYLGICDAAASDSAEQAIEVEKGLRQILSGELTSFTTEYPCHALAEQRWFRLTINPLNEGGLTGAVVMHVNITERKLTEEALADSERRFRSTFEQAAVGMAQVSIEGRFLRVNERLCSITGYSREELRRMSFLDLTLPEDRMNHLAARHAILAGEQDSYLTEKRYRRKNGDIVWINLATALERNESGDPEYFISVFEDITSRKLTEFRLHRLNRLHAVLSKVSEVTVRVRDRQELYEKVCHIMVEDGHLRTAFITELNPETGLILPVATFGEGQNHFQGISVRADGGPLSQGPMGTAFRTGQPDVCNDFQEDPRTAPWREKARRLGFLACAAFPIKQDGFTVAALALYAGEADYFQEDEIRLMISVAGDVSFALESLEEEQKRQQAEQALKAKETTLSIAQSIAHVGSWEMDLANLDDRQEYSLAWSAEMYRIAGFEPGQIPVTRDLFYRLVHPDDREAVRQSVALALQTRQDYSVVHRFIRPDGEERIVHESGQLFFDEQNGAPLKIIGTAHDITEQRAAEEELRQANALLKAVTEGSPDAIFVKDLEGRYLLFNEGAARLVGRTVQEVLGKDDTFLFSPDDARFVMESDRRVIAANETQIVEEVLTAAGVRRTYLAMKGPYRDAHGKVIGLIGISRDVTERMNAEKALRESEERFQLAVRGSSAAIWDWNLLTGDIYYAPLYLEMLGYAEGEFPPRIETFQQHLHPEDKEGVNQALTAHFSEERRRFNVEFRMRTKSGPYRWFRITGQAVYDADGRAYRMAGSTYDITQRKMAEEKLREQATLLDKAQDAILVRDLDHHIRYWNHGAERLYGWTAGEAMGQSIKDLLYKEPSAFLQATATAIARGEWVGELQQVTKEGKPVSVEARWTLMRDDRGQPQAILAINTDITERKKLEQQFLRSQRMESIGTLAGGIAHDLNNVLSPIMMSIELLRMKESDPQRLSILSAIESSARRGASMVSQVLSFARGVEGQQIEVQVAHLLQEIEKIANETFLKSIRVHSHIPVNLWAVQGDPTQLHQVLLNLCVNARDAMPHGGILKITAENEMLDTHYAAMNMEARPGPYVVIRVEDSGCGMPPEVVERIFEPFYTTKEVGKGTGLGLSTTLAIIKSHGGFVQVYSEVGTGTQFSVYLPAQTVTAGGQETPSEIELPRGHGELILVVDDEAPVRQITRQTLEAFGYRVLLAADGAEATAIYATHLQEISAVLTDMMMPIMDGPTTIPVLLRMNPAARIIAASGLNANGMVARAAHAGVNHFLPKPYTAETLLRTLQKILSEDPLNSRSAPPTMR